jgi:hypothetical protein
MLFNKKTLSTSSSGSSSQDQLLLETYLAAVNTLIGEGPAFNTYQQKLLKEFDFLNQNQSQMRSFFYSYFKSYPQIISAYESKNILPFKIDLIRDNTRRYHLAVGSVSGFDFRVLPRGVIFEYYVEYETAVVQKYFNPDALMAFKNLLDAYYDRNQKPAIFIQLDEIN